MIFNGVFYVCITFLFAAGAYLLLSKENEEYRFRSYEALRRRFKGRAKTDKRRNSVNVLEQTGYFISREKYLTGWMLIMGMMLAMGLFLTSRGWIILAGAVLLIGLPLEKAVGYRTPFGYILKHLQDNYMHKKEREMYDGMTMLRNLAIMNREKPVSADVMIEGLMEGARYMAPHYLRMIHFIRLNRKQEALESFIRDVGSPMASSFARLLLKLDEINPVRLEETIVMHQKAIREERLTKSKEKDELISDLIYIPAIFNVLLIFINFMIIAYFIPQKEFFSMFLR